MRAQMSLGGEAGDKTHSVENTILSTLDFEDFIHAFVALTAFVEIDTEYIEWCR